MLKNNDLIAQLTDNQKVRLLTDVGNLSGKDFKILGIRGVKVRNIKDYCRDIFPHSTILAHSWNEQLWSRVAEVKTARLIDDGANLAIIPGSKIKLSPYRVEVTEDPYFATRFAVAHATAAEATGIKASLSGYYLTESDEEWLDKEPSAEILNEFLTQPYIRAIKEGKNLSLLTDIRSVSAEYQSVSRSMQDELSENHYLICADASEKNTVDFISRGIICLSASANALESALARYKKLEQAADRDDGVTLEQIRAEEMAHSVISPDAVDSAVDRVIGFINSLGEVENIQAGDENEIAYRATVESSVLLKNKDGVLPLSKKSTVALIGDAFLREEDGLGGLDALKKELEDRGCSCVGVDRGYDFNDITKCKMMDKAMKLASSASAVILFLGFGHENEKQIPRTKSLELPVNQLRLADMLVRRHINVIGVISAGHAPDIAFTRGFKALMLVPTDVKSSAAAIASLLCGNESPSGKLAYSLYAGSERAFEKRALYKEKYGLKAGPFIGYRYYDTADLNLGYPFGHGLSYTSFAYSDLVYRDGKVSFNIENTGKVRAKDVVQIYVGYESDKIIRPKKELCGFAKIELAPQEVKKVSVDIELPCVYQSGKPKTVGGTYVIYVGESSYDIRLSKRFGVRGESVVSDGERLRDYLQSVPNVKEDNFTLEAKYDPMKKTSHKKTVVGLLLLILAIGLFLYNTVEDSSSATVGALAGILVIVSMILFAVDFLKIRSDYADDIEQLKTRNSEYFADAIQIPILSTAKIFDEEFDEIEEEEPEVVQSIEPDVDKSVDAGFKLSDLAYEIALFAKERGMNLDAGVAEQLTVSLVNSRFIILEGLEAEEFNSLMLILSDYFATKAYVENLDGEQKNDLEMFFGFDDHGDYVKKPIVLALEDASRSSDKVHILAVNGANEATFDKLTAPFASYLSSPRSVNSVYLSDAHGQSVGYSVSNNLKLIVRLDDCVSVEMLSAAVLRTASCNRVSFVKCQAQVVWTAHHTCTRFQLEYILEKEKTVAAVTEQVYKKIDRLENYASSHADYKIGNKLWLALERQMGLLLSAKIEMDDAVDAAIAAKLLPSMSAALHNNLSAEDETLKETVTFVLGEEHAVSSLKLVEIIESKQVRRAELEEEKAREEARRAAEEKEAEQLGESLESSEESEADATDAQTADTEENTPEESEADATDAQTANTEENAPEEGEADATDAQTADTEENAPEESEADATDAQTADTEENVSEVNEAKQGAEEDV